MVKIAGCNDCHTPGFAQNNGETPEKDWLVGVPVGFKGPWGISFPTNLRLMVQTFKEAPFINHIRSKKYAPPMPGYQLTAMTDDELSALYTFIRYLGPAGEKAPNFMPPGQKSSHPYIYFVPVEDKN